MYDYFFDNIFFPIRIICMEYYIYTLVRKEMKNIIIVCYLCYIKFMLVLIISTTYVVYYNPLL